MQEISIRTAVVTGPTGAIGCALCGYLLQKNVKVYAVTRPNSERLGQLPQGVQIVPCDIEQLYMLKEKIAKPIDAFFHLAWAHTIGNGRNDMLAQTNNIRNAIEAVHAASTLGCKVFVGAGSQAEYGRIKGKLTGETPCFPENGYGMAKLCAGEMTRVECTKAGIRHQWARILSIYGPGDTRQSMISSVIAQLLKGEKPALTRGEQMWDYLYASDAAAALYGMACRGKDGKVYPVGSGTARPLREYIEILRDQIDPALPLGFGEISYGSQQVMHLQADITELEIDTGFEPSVAFEDGIRETIRFEQKEREKKRQ